MNSRKQTNAGTETRKAILEAAAQVLFESGHHKLTMRSVSDAAEISLGNLTYHFPNKAVLVEALVLAKLDDYLAQFEKMAIRKSASSDDALGQLISWLLMDSADETTSRIFRELWAMSSHYPAIAEAFSNYYKTSIDKVAELFFCSCPKERKEDLLKALDILALISEGTCIVFAGNKRMDIDIEDLIPEVVGIFQDYLLKKDIPN
jgi:AcrR family transcriptional regulator